MLTQKTFTALFICFLLIGQSLGQQLSSSSIKRESASPELQQESVNLLRQTISEIPKLQTEENRQYFTIETARLLWKYDEPAARTMFESEMANVRKSVAQIVSASSPKYLNSVIGEKYHRLERDLVLPFESVSSLRSHLIKNLAIVEPEMAYKFLVETLQMLPKVDGDLKFRDMFYHLEEDIIRAFIAANEIDKALKVVQGMVAEDFSDTLVSQIKVIYEQNAQKGNSLAEYVLQNIKSAKLNTNQNYIIQQFLEAAIESKKQNKRIPLLDDSSIRDLAKLLGQSVLSIKTVSYTLDKPFEYADLLEKYAPQEAMQIRQKFKKNLPANAASIESETELSESVKRQVKDTMKDFKSERTANQKREDETKEIFQKLESNSFSSSERAQLIKQIKELISDMKDVRRRNEKTKAIIDFAVKSKDRTITEELMNEAVALTNPQTKSYEDFMSKWRLAVGYSSFEPEKSFTVLEDIIPKFSEVITGFSKVAEFSDDSNSLFANGEVKMASGLGDGVGAMFFKDLTGNQTVIRSLAKSNFARTKALTDKFDSIEFRMAARILVLDSLL